MSDLTPAQHAMAERLLDLIRDPAHEMIWVQGPSSTSTCEAAEVRNWQSTELDFESEENLRQVIEASLVPLIHLGPKTEERWRDPIERRISAVIEIPAAEGKNSEFALLDVFWHHIPEREKPTMALIVKHDAELYD